MELYRRYENGYRQKEIKITERQLERSLRGGHWRCEKAISQHRHQEWETSMYRRVNDIKNDTMPDLEKYECEMMEKDGTRREYKKMSDGKAFGCLAQWNLL